MTGPGSKLELPGRPVGSAELAAGVAPLVAMVAGAGLGSAVLAVQVAYQAHRFTRMKATVEALFPTGADGR